LRILAREAPAALLLLLGCAGGGEAARRDLDALRTEVRALRSENEALSRRVDALAGRVEVLQTRVARAPAAPEPAASSAPIVPPDLAVVRVEPREEPPLVLEQPARSSAPARRAPRTPPPVPTAVPIAEPDPERLETVARPSRREISADADDELSRARRRSGSERAHGLEDFVGRYPRHPSADNALVEAAAAYADAGLASAGCELARRSTVEYPAGDAMSEALERLAWCEARSGSTGGERRLLQRLVSEFPSTPAAERAGTRLATISGGTGDTPAPAPARSGP
jgi:TolA-binding protein